MGNYDTDFTARAALHERNPRRQIAKPVYRSAVVVRETEAASLAGPAHDGS